MSNAVAIYFWDASAHIRAEVRIFWVWDEAGRLHESPKRKPFILPTQPRHYPILSRPIKNLLAFPTKCAVMHLLRALPQSACLEDERVWILKLLCTKSFVDSLREVMAVLQFHTIPKAKWTISNPHNETILSESEAKSTQRPEIKGRDLKRFVEETDFFSDDPLDDPEGAYALILVLEENRKADGLPPLVQFLEAAPPSEQPPSDTSAPPA
jgi:hypothetical protein